MPYSPTNWKDHIVERPRTYAVEENEDGSKTITPAYGKVIQQGTPQNAENFNKIEQALKRHDDAIWDKMPVRLDMGGHAVENLATPTAAGDAVPLGYLSGLQKILTVTVGTDWTGEAAPYMQTVNVPGILGADVPLVDLVPSDNFATAQGETEAYGYVYRVKSGDGNITLYASEKPGIPLQIQIMWRSTNGAAPETYRAILVAGPGPIDAEIDGVSHPMENTELSMAPSKPGMYSFEII